MNREAWTWADSRTGKRVSITSTLSRSQAERRLQEWRERDARGQRPDLHEAMPFIVVVQLTDETWGSNPGDRITSVDN